MLLRRQARRLGELLARSTSSAVQTPAPLLSSAGQFVGTMESCWLGARSTAPNVARPLARVSWTAPLLARQWRVGLLRQTARSHRGVHAAAEPLPLSHADALGGSSQPLRPGAPPLPPPAPTGRGLSPPGLAPHSQTGIPSAAAAAALAVQQAMGPQVLPRIAPPVLPQVAPAAAAWAPPSLVPAIPPAASHTLWVEGTVQRVQFRCANTSYTVLKLQVATTEELERAAAAAGAGALFAPKPRGRARFGRGAAPSAAGSATAPAAAGAAVGVATAHRPRKVSLTVVGNLPQVAVGQALRFAGSWGEHRQYGWQFRANDLQVGGPLLGAAERAALALQDNVAPVVYVLSFSFRSDLGTRDAGLSRALLGSLGLAGADASE